MEDSSNINELPDLEIINDLAIELAVDPSFIEKDWFAVQIIKIISSINQTDILPVFSGGTSLSKGYGIIKRFSEDVDFKVITDSNTITRSQRRGFREKVIRLIDSHKNFTVNNDSLESRDESRFFSFNINYPSKFPLHKALRSHLKIEMTFQELLLESEKRNISSLIAYNLNNTPEALIDCVSPVETSADKLSAFLWRIEIRNRKAQIGTTKNDPTMIRHLYDLSALRDFIINNENFLPVFIKTIKKDSGRGGSEKTLSIKEKIELSISKLQDDKEYSTEYENFVNAMFYGPESERIDFTTAFNNFKEIADFILSSFPDGQV